MWAASTKTALANTVPTGCGRPPDKDGPVKDHWTGAATDPPGGQLSARGGRPSAAIAGRQSAEGSAEHQPNARERPRCSLEAEPLVSGSAAPGRRCMGWPLLNPRRPRPCPPPLIETRPQRRRRRLRRKACPNLRRGAR
eukprot:64752-Chlamydomonas_euryale.AAC.10